MSQVSLSAIEQQKAIYIRGIAGKKPLVPVGFEELERKALQCISVKAGAYIAGGAGGELTMQRNRRALDQVTLIPRMLKDVSAVSMERNIFGEVWPVPFALAPIGVLEMVHRQADLAVARASRATGVPMIWSNQASVPMEACAKEAADAPRWFQLYWSKNNDLVKSLVQRAEAAGCSAIVVTLDTTMLGWRTRDLDLAYLPFLEGRGIAQYTSDPEFMQLAAENREAGDLKPPLNLKTLKHVLSLAYRFPGSFLGNLRSGIPLKAVRTFIRIYSRPSLTWNDLAFLRKITDLPIILKGICHPDDVRLALEHDVQGIILSNHGGRQVDGAVASFEMLKKAAGITGGRMELFIDSGIRSGADIMKCLCLGASAVMIGRPYVYGLALAGAEGVEQVIRNLAADFELTMRLCGCQSVDEPDSSLILKG